MQLLASWRAELITLLAEIQSIHFCPIIRDVSTSLNMTGGEGRQSVNFAAHTASVRWMNLQLRSH